MTGLLVVFFPLLLLGFLLFMERVEEPLRRVADNDVETFLDKASDQDMDNLYRFGVRRALHRWRTRRSRRPRLATTGPDEAP